MVTMDVTRIASNIGALNALNSLQWINARLALHQTRLSTGRRINSASDDPAGLDHRDQDAGPLGRPESQHR